MTTEEWQQHVKDCVRQAEETLKQRYCDVILPLCKDAILYLDRSEPNIDAAIGKIRRVEENIGMWLDE